jgi:hypothetical protein
VCTLACCGGHLSGWPIGQQQQQLWHASCKRVVSYEWQQRRGCLVQVLNRSQWYPCR